MALTLVLNDFSGPLDLLWHLIRTNEVDIYDIPIAEITTQYLELPAPNAGFSTGRGRRLFCHGR